MNNHELQNSVYQNAAMGITALKQIIPSVNDKGLRELLEKQYNGYKKQTEITARQMKANDQMPSFPPLSSRMMAKAGIAMKLRRDRTRGNIAKMLIKGTNNGIIELTQNLNHTRTSTPETIASAKAYLRREQKYIESLKTFL